MHIRGTDFVMFLVSDLPRAVGFYRDVLGKEIAASRALQALLNDAGSRQASLVHRPLQFG